MLMPHDASEPYIELVRLVHSSDSTNWETRMLNTVILVCSAALTPNLADCSPANAKTTIRVPIEVANPVTCLMQGQALLAQTSLANELGHDDRVKIVCVRREPVAAMK
jgi:hypothetical protein